jgi:hypothetical protein
MLFEAYQQQSNLLTPDLRDVAGVLYSIVQTIVQHDDQKDSSIDDGTSATLDEFYTENGEFIKISEIASQSFLSSLLRTNGVLNNVTVNQLLTSPVIFNAEENFRKKLFSARVLHCNNNNNNGNNSISSIEQKIRQFEFDALVRLHISRLLSSTSSSSTLSSSSSSSLPYRSSMSEVERGIKESELLTFTSLCPSDLYRSNQLQEFSEMILQQTKALPNFTGLLTVADGEEGSILKRKYFKSIPAFVFVELLSREMKTNPLILKKYYSMTDELLFALHWPPPERRNKKEIWQRTIVDGNLEDNLTKEIVWEKVTMTPAGQMIAILNRLNHNNNSNSSSSSSWLTAYLKDYLIGFRNNTLIKINKPFEDATTSKKGTKKRNSVSSTRSSVSAGEGNDNQSTTSIQTLPPSFSFFFESNDGIRITSFAGITKEGEIIKKPDKFGTVCVSIDYPNNLRILLNSNGNIIIQTNLDNLLSQSPFSEESSSSLSFYKLFPEISRLISENGNILRTFASSNSKFPQIPFQQELLYANGERFLFLIDSFQRYLLPLKKSSNQEDEEEELRLSSPRGGNNGKQQSPRPFQDPSKACYELNLLYSIPKETWFVHFDVSGKILCYDRNHSILSFNQSNSISAPSTSTIKEEMTDAESKSITRYYHDGRIITEYKNQITIALFPDHTKYIMNKKTNMLLINRHIGFPEIEMDLEVDSSSRKHSQGMEIPINKGGNRVRSRIALPDGSAAFIKYDTRVTAKANGSIRFIKPDRTNLFCKDDCSVEFYPSTTWSKEVRNFIIFFLSF